jgi:sterol 14-demethylase
VEQGVGSAFSLLKTQQPGNEMELANDFAASLVAGNVCAWIVTVMVVAYLYSCLPEARGPGHAPYPPVVWAGGWPLIGNFLAFTKPVGMVRDLSKEHGSVFTMKMMGQRLTFMVGRDARCTFYRSRDDVLSQAEVYGFMTPVFGKGVVYDAPKHIRSQQMQFLANGLRTASLKQHVEHIAKECESFFSKFPEKGTMDLKSVLGELIILTSSRALMGDMVRETLHEEVAHLYHDLDKGITPLSFFFPNAPIPGHYKRDAARKEMVKLFARVIKKRRAEIEASGETGENASKGTTAGGARMDVLGLLITSKYKDGGSVTDDQIVGLLIALLFAGQHTSSITSTWCTMFLLQHPQMLDRVRSEQDRVLGGGNEIDFDALGDMGLLHSCIKETLRHYPPLILLMRKVMQDVEVPLGAAADKKGGKSAAKDDTEKGECVTIPKGDIVLTAPAFGRFDEGCFKGCDDFDPDRFDKGEKNADGTHTGRAEDAPPFSFVGFGGGMHACMGQQFAYLQLKIVLSILLKHFDLEMTGPFPQPDYEAMVVGPKGNCPVRYTRRSGTKGAGASSKSKAASSSKKSAAKASAASAAKAPAKGPKSNGKTFSRAEVAKHNTRKDAWIIVEGKVYDVTSFVEDHPGGDAILSTVGGDSTEGFLGDQHPPTVRDVLDGFYIGDLA